MSSFLCPLRNKLLSISKSMVCKHHSPVYYILIKKAAMQSPEIDEVWKALPPHLRKKNLLLIEQRKLAHKIMHPSWNAREGTCLLLLEALHPLYVKVKKRRWLTWREDGTGVGWKWDGAEQPVKLKCLRDVLRFRMALGRFLFILDHRGMMRRKTPVQIVFCLLLNTLHVYTLKIIVSVSPEEACF